MILKFPNLVNFSEAATETVFQNICSFFSRSNLFIIFQEGPFVPRTDMNFPGGSICSSDRHEFSRRVYRKDMFFQGGSICSSNTPYYLIEQILIFPETLIYTSNTYEFSRSSSIFLSNPRTHTIF